MKLIVGLGNPGQKYEKTRHNIGFIIMDNYCSENTVGSWKKEKLFNAEIIKNNDIIYCKPQTYMNNSGESIKKIIDYYKISHEDILVIYDEIDLPLGKIQKKIGGSAAGHNGIKSILLHLGNNNIFTKIRVGVDRPLQKEDIVDRVLGTFSKTEIETIQKLFSEVFSHIEEFIKK